MGCSTTGFVLTKEKDPFKIWKVIKAALFEEMKKDSGVDNVTAVWGKNYTMPRCEISDFAEHMVISFKFKKEDRQMHVNLTCDHDYEEVRRGKRVVISLGSWGSSVRLMTVALNALSEFGEAYIIDDDCSGKWRKL